MDKEKHFKINFNSNGRTFFYKGTIQSEDDDFITFWDERLGAIRLNKKNILSIVPMNGVGE